MHWEDSGGLLSGHVGVELAQKHVKRQLTVRRDRFSFAAHSDTHIASKTFSQSRSGRFMATGEWLIVRWRTETIDSRFGNHWINAPGLGSAIRRESLNGIHLYPKDRPDSKSPSRPSTSRSGLRGFWMRRTPCGPSAARPSPSSTPSSNPPSSTCSATPSYQSHGVGCIAFRDTIGNSRLGEMLDKGKEDDASFPTLRTPTSSRGRFDLAGATMDFLQKSTAKTSNSRIFS